MIYFSPMEASDFGPEITGRLVPLPDGPADARVAFVPNPLPPDWTWPERLWPLLLEARTALASLSGMGKHLKSAEILLRPLQLREAQLSSQLEGTITDPHQQVLFHAEPSYPTSENDPKNAFREIFNYTEALRLRLDREREWPLSLALIRELHKILMDGVRGSDQSPGQFRKIQNQIQRPARFVPPPPLYLDETLGDLETFLRNTDLTTYDPLVRAFLAHYQFEAIHPFRDGNGRVGRLLLALCISEWCDLPNQWLYMSAYFEQHKTRYMDLLLAVSTHGAWEPWIEFCLRGVISQSKDTEKRADNLLGLHREFQERLKGGSVRLAALIDKLFEYPVVTVTWVQNQFGVTHPTARADLRRLESMGIVRPLAAPRLTYYCDRILNITYEGVR